MVLFDDVSVHDTASEPRRPAQTLEPAVPAINRTVHGDVEATPRRRGAQARKRMLDLLVASLALIPAIPIVVLAAVAIKATSRGPVLFRQVRVGRNGAPVTVLKLRTMHCDAEAQLDADPAIRAEYVANGYKLPLGADPRITRVGRLLRRTSLDELPQLFNVLRGDMSVVGPRPVLFEELELYGDHMGAYLSVKPGITGRWQTEGRDGIGYPLRAELDAEYARTWSTRTDCMILLRTAKVVLLARGVE